MCMFLGCVFFNKPLQRKHQVEIGNSDIEIKILLMECFLTAVKQLKIYIYVFLECFQNI